MNTLYKDIKYVLIQAGGLGSRMLNYTKNKPKCLIPYKGKTLIEHQINFFKDKKIYIICDYKKDILVTYIQNVLKLNNVTFIESDKKTTSSGVIKFLENLNEDEPFIFTWSDLIFESNFPKTYQSPITVLLTDSFPCRWSVENNKMVKKLNSTNGISGVFVIQSKKFLNNINEEVSFVGGNLNNLPENNISFDKFESLSEIGEKEIYENYLSESSKSRFFNKVVIEKDTVIKKCIDSNYNNLITNEIDWYTFINDKIDFIPKLISINPMTLSKINGSHIFEKKLNSNEKEMIIDSIITNLNKIHDLGTSNIVHSDMIEIYFNKTIERVNSVKYVIPFFKNKKIKINGELYKNPFFGDQSNEILNTISQIISGVTNFNVIHGDPTFSNILIGDKFNSFLIDPRGIFGKTKIYGDKNYDWAKLFYSVNGNYDSINSKKFDVDVLEDGVNINIVSNGFEEFSEKIIKFSGMSKKQMYLHQSLIWFSLTGYVKEDIDSIMYSFYYGIIQWNLAMN
jgi:CTP:phosphocholine cytidylyltransferase-like protein